MAKYNKRIVKHICDLISKDTYTVAEICSLSGISESTYFEWKANKAEFSERLTRAREKFDEILVQEAKNSLRKKITGYTVQEKHITYIDSNIKDESGKIVSKPKIKEQKIIDKHFQPDTNAIIFALTNKAPEEYKNRVNNEVTGKDGKDLFAALSDEELNKKIADLEAKLK
jgi:hypothetical protein